MALQITPWRARSGPRAGQPLWVVDPITGCWMWLGATAKGYGVAYKDGRRTGAHIRVFEASVGPVPEGLVLDHLCRTPLCVRPDHLEPVPQQVNVDRGIGLTHQDVCSEGHDLRAPRAIAHVGGRRRCRGCWNAYMRRYKKKARA